MRLLEKYKTLEDVSIHVHSRYNRRAESYSCRRIIRAFGTDRKYELFWINIHYLYGLMNEKNPQRFL